VARETTGTPGAFVYLTLRKIDNVFEWLEKAYEGNDILGAAPFMGQYSFSEW
jgi:hypothetical protein